MTAGSQGAEVVVVKPSMMYLQKTMVSYQVAACRSREKICAVTTVPGLYSPKVWEGVFFMDVHFHLQGFLL